MTKLFEIASSDMPPAPISSSEWYSIARSRIHGVPHAIRVASSPALNTISPAPRPNASTRSVCSKL